jgi:hypothetical protein
MRYVGTVMSSWGHRMSQRRDEWNGSAHLDRQQIDQRNDRLVKELLAMIMFVVVAVLFSAWAGML